MQRKNNILKSARNGMAMMMAIIVLLVVATVMALSLSLTMQTSKRTTDIYLYEQSVLLSQSAAEYAMLRISQAAPCSLGNITTFGYGGDGTVGDDIYTIEITMQYISNAGSLCAGFSVGNTFATVTYVPAAGEVSSDGSVVMDITVTANPDGTTEPIRYFRRSIQKL